VAFQTHELGGPLDVSLNHIVNGAFPDQLLNELLITELESAPVVKDATGADETLIHVGAEMLEPNEFVAFS
jgi:hypothetical protein